MKEQHNCTQEKKKNTLIINYPPMVSGGIETCFEALMKECIARGDRVIWITSKRFLGQVAFDGILDNPGLEIVLTKPWHHFFGNPRIELTEEERVVMYTCEPLKYIVSEGIRKKAGTKRFKHYLTIPHFTGNEYFPDGYLNQKTLQEHIYRYLQKILGRMAESDCILGFDQKHLSVYEDHYHIPLPDKDRKLVHTAIETRFLYNPENTKARCAERKDRFVITTCSRFDFPHKAYLLGLVDAFKTVKMKHPQAVLQIIGDGDGARELKRKISLLPEDVSRDIHLLGTVTPDVLAKHYLESQLVVGLAGAIENSARCGIPSLVVRHYHDSCETYGYYEDALDKGLCEERGMDIVPFLEDCITMDPETYLQHAEKAFDCVTLCENVTRNPILEGFENAEKSCPVFIRNRREAFAGRFLYVICSILRRLGR